MYAIRSYYGQIPATSAVQINWNDPELNNFRQNVQGDLDALGSFEGVKRRLELRITSYNVCYTKLLRTNPAAR